MRTRKGFTLIELLIVIAVLGALTAMMTLSSAGAVDAAKAARIIDGLNTVKTAVQMYVAEYANGSPIVGDKNKGFISVSADYFDASTFDNVKTFEVVSVDSAWYVHYKLDAATGGVNNKLNGHTNDGLLKEKGTTAYDGGQDVYMRAH